MKFTEYIEILLKDYEKKISKYKKEKSFTKKLILIQAFSSIVGINDYSRYLANDEIKWIEKNIPFSKIIDITLNPTMDEFFVERAHGSAEEFQKLYSKDNDFKKRFNRYVGSKAEMEREFKDPSRFYEEIFIVPAGNQKDKYKILCGHERFILELIKGKSTFKAFAPESQSNLLMISNKNLLDDIITAFENSNGTHKDMMNLKSALELLINSYSNISNELMGWHAQLGIQSTYKYTDQLLNVIGIVLQEYDKNWHAFNIDKAALINESGNVITDSEEISRLKKEIKN